MIKSFLGRHLRVGVWCSGENATQDAGILYLKCLCSNSGSTSDPNFLLLYIQEVEDQIPQVLESLPATWKIWIEFLDPGFHLEQPLLFRQGLNQQMNIPLSL